MKTRVALAGVLAVTAFTLTSGSAMAIPTAGQLKSRCADEGGTFFRGNRGGSYGCMLQDGAGVVCGGLTQAQKNSCSTFRAVPTSELPPWATGASGGNR